MSKFLGPIHYWLYNKICIQESNIQRIITSLDEDKQKEVQKLLEQQISSLFTISPNDNLELLIDQEDIHGWLQERVTTEEKKYAFIVNEILEKNWKSMEQIENIVFEAGAALGRNKCVNTPEEAYKLLQDTLLDGMPCDHIYSVVSSNEKELIYTQTRCIHKEYWASYNNNVDVYYILRNAFVQGMLLTSPIAIKKLNEKEYCLYLNGITVLMAEHQNILRMTKVIRAACYGILQGQSVDDCDFEKIIDFIRNYADVHHHGKEEKMLFAEMLNHLGKIGENLIRHGMFVEHDLGRLHVKELEEALKDLQNGNDECKLDIIANAISYTHLITRHINKEDELIYTYAEKNLSSEILSKVDAETLEYEKDANKKEIQKKYEAVLCELEEKYL